jgi:RNase H-like protein
MSGRNRAKQGVARKYLAFDIETVKVQPANDYDWKSYRPLGISCAATFLSGEDDPLLWHGGANDKRPTKRMNRPQVQGLVGYLEKQVVYGYTVVTWNGLGFDFDILAEESGMLEKCRNLAIDHVDMMFHALRQLGHGISLDSAAKGMGLAGKSENLSGISTPQLWAKGRRKEVLEYVAHDAEITLELAEISESHGLLRWVTRGGRGRKLPLPKGWLPVRLAEKLPITGTSWMWPQWSRARFTAWLD